MWLIPLVVVLALLGFVLYVSSGRALSQLEVVMFEVLTLGLGVFGSFWFGRTSAMEAARDMVRPHARSALRTILALRDSLERLSGRIEEYKTEGADHRLDIIQAIVNEQMPICGSAVEDWHDIVPTDVDEVIKRWSGNTEV